MKRSKYFYRYIKTADRIKPYIFMNNNGYWGYMYPYQFKSISGSMSKVNAYVNKLNGEIRKTNNTLNNNH